MARGAPYVAPERKDAALIYGSGTQTAVGFTYTTVTLGSVALDYLDTTGTANRITIPSTLDGRKARIYAGAVATDNLSIRVLKNGSSYTGLAGGLADSAGASGVNAFSGVITLATGDYFELQLRSAGGSVVDADLSSCWLGLELLPATFKGALVYGGGNVTSDGTTRDLVFASEVYDTDGFYNVGTSTTRLTVPSGVSLVRLSGSIGWASTTSGQHVVSMAKNGASFPGVAAKDVSAGLTDTKAVTTVSTPQPVTAGDYFTLQHFSATSNTLGDTDNRWFQIEVLEPTLKYAVVQRTTNQTATAGTLTASWDSVLNDAGNWRDAAQPTKLIVPNGVKQVKVSAQLTRTSATTQWVGSITKNGATFPGAARYDNDTAGADTVNITTGPIDVVPGDYFEVIINSTSGSLTTADGTWFCIEECFGEPQLDGAVIETIDMTVPTTSVSADLTGFPVMVNLADMPARFWAAVNDSGGNIRARTADGVFNIPHDLTFFDVTRQIGRLFVKLNLSNSVDTEFTIVVLEESDSALSVSSSNGQYAVWSDYEYAVVMPALTNRTGAYFSSASSGWQPYTPWIRHDFRRLSGNPHQGVTSDGTNFFWVDTNAIYRGNMSYTLLNSDTDIGASLATAGLANVNHLGDPCMYDGALWLTATTSTSQRWLVRFNATTLAPENWYQIDPAYAAYGATLLHDGTDFVLFAYTVGTSFIRVSEVGVFVSQTTISAAISNIQGSTLLPSGNFLVVQNQGSVYELNPAGAIQSVVYIDPHSSIGEGMQYLTISGVPTLFLLKGDGDLVTLRKEDDHFDFRKIHYNNAYVDLPYSSTWSIGATVFWTSADYEQAFIALYNPSSVDSALEVAYDEGPDKIGSYNLAEGWLYSSPDDTPAIYSDRIYGLTSNGSTRKLYNSGDVASDAIAGAIPSSNTTMRFMFNAARPGIREREAYYQFLWMRTDVVSDAWMEADHLNKSAPTTFYTVGA
jgi:hypothetical protein